MARGFTLIEVLVALLIFAVSAAAITVQVSDSLNQAHGLDQRLNALWLADNRLTEMQVARDFPAVGQRSDSVRRAGREWWLRTDVTDTEDELLRRVVVQVGPADNEQVIYAELVGFVGRH